MKLTEETAAGKPVLALPYLVRLPHTNPQNKNNELAFCAIQTHYNPS